MMASILQIFFYIFIFLLIVGDTVFHALGIPLPEFLKGMIESRLMYSIGGFFVFAQISTMLRSTGAFEVFINDDLVYSKLATGQ
jgi:hypothetical protein